MFASRQSKAQWKVAVLVRTKIIGIVIDQAQKQEGQVEIPELPGIRNVTNVPEWGI